MADANPSRPTPEKPKPRPRKKAGEELSYEEAIEKAEGSPGLWFECRRGNELLKVKRTPDRVQNFAHGQVLRTPGGILTRRIDIVAKEKAEAAKKAKERR